MLSKYWKVVLIVVLLTPLLASCWNAEELDKMSYIHSIGVDFKDHEYKVYIQVVNFAYLTSQGAPSSQSQTQAVVGVGTGKTFVDAIRDVYKKSSRRMFWGHLSSVVFTEDGLKQGLIPVLDLFSRYHEIRYNLWVYTTHDPLRKLLTTFPPTEISEVYAKLGDPRDALRQSSFIKPQRMFEFIRKLYEPGSTIILPKLSLSQNKWFDGNKETSSLTMDNATILTQHAFKGFMGPEDTKGLLFFEQAPRFFIYVKITDDENVTLTFSRPKTKIIAHYKNGRPYFDFNVKAKAIIEEVDKEIPADVLHKKAVSHITSLINHTYQTALKRNIDIYNLSHDFYLKYPKAWHKLEHNGQIPLNKDSLNIHLDLKFHSSYKANYKTLFDNNN